MNIDIFINKLTSRYSTNATDIKIEDIEDYIKRTNITELQLDTINLLMQENYGKTSFPFVKDIKDIYEKGYSIISGQKHVVDRMTEKTDDIYYPTTFVDYVCNKKNMQIEDIIKYYKIYETKNMNGHEMNTYERYFLFVFSDLITNYRARKRRKCDDNRIKTENELNMLLNDTKIEIEREPDPTPEDMQLIKEMFKSVSRNKIIGV